jgi:hypothetical protein
MFINRTHYIRVDRSVYRFRIYAHAKNLFLALQKHIESEVKKVLQWLAGAVGL